jgi:hypothetical protein
MVSGSLEKGLRKGGSRCSRTGYMRRKKLCLYKETGHLSTYHGLDESKTLGGIFRRVSTASRSVILQQSLPECTKNKAYQLGRKTL